MKYVTCAEAREMKGLRLVLSCDGPNVWCEAAKYVFAVRHVPYAAVGKRGMEDTEDNLALFAWTGHKNSPIAMYEDEKARVGWLDILYLAERIGRPVFAGSPPAASSIILNMLRRRFQPSPSSPQS